MEQTITFPADGLILEGLLNHQTASDKGVVIAHPHPLYGGDMYNPVVKAIARAYEQKNHTTLKINFRGVGHSRGHYDNGVGEQLDLIGGMAFLEELGMTQIDLAGYSFGAWAICQLHNLPPTTGGVYLISPPVAMMPFEHTPAMDRVKGIITGGQDDIAPPAEIKKRLRELKSSAPLEIISHADHFYSGHFDTIESRLCDVLS